MADRERRRERPRGRGTLFDEAQRRDPAQRRQWVVLVDGLNHQIDCIEAEARERGLDVIILVAVIHVLEYLYNAAWCFFDEGDPEAEPWVHGHAVTIFHGRSSDVAGAVRRKATYVGLDESDRKVADKCADHLINKRPYLDYATALDSGWPIATGVIEGACRHLIMDRMASERPGRWKALGQRRARE